MGDRLAEAIETVFVDACVRAHSAIQEAGCLGPEWRKWHDLTMTLEALHPEIVANVIAQSKGKT